jgi:acetolactate synthase-1/2/3 large subunit
MTVAEYVVRYLAKRGVSHVFELAGGMICPLLDAASREGAPKLVSMHHEQAAGFAAEGWARMKGVSGGAVASVPGVAMATSGPGATNLLTAIGSCYFDSTPAVFITGQVNRDELKGDRTTRQLGFQETDICAIARPIVKHAVQVEHPQAIAGVLNEAFRLATQGRPGPVLVDIPFDVQRSEARAGIPTVEVHTERRPALIDRALELLRDAKRPLVLVGGGARGSHEALEHLGIPVVNSLLGTDTFPYDHLLRVGFIGTYGNRWANWALMQSDVLLVLGSRLDVRQTGADVDSFAKRKIIHVDIDPAELRNRVPVELAINVRVEDFCAAVRERIAAPTAWMKAIQAKRREWLDFSELRVVPPAINPNRFLYELGHVSARAAAFVGDVGQHQMWAAQSLALAEGQRFLTSGGMGAMGFALPAAIGAYYATGKPIVMIAGDGGFQVNIQELQTVRRNDLPLKMVVLNNDSHGMVRQFQDEVFEGWRVSTQFASPRFAAIAGAYQIDAMTIHADHEIEGALRWLWNADSPRLLEVTIPPEANAWPKTMFGRPLDEMEPKR